MLFKSFSAEKHPAELLKNKHYLQQAAALLQQAGLAQQAAPSLQQSCSGLQQAGFSQQVTPSLQQSAFKSQHDLQDLQQFPVDAQPATKRVMPAMRMAAANTDMSFFIVLP